MQVIIHRVNKIEQLAKIPTHYGVEIDIRGFGDKLVLTHEPFEDGDELEEYLKGYKHAFVIFNIKEAGIEKRVIDLAKKYKIKNYFLLDVEPYWIHHATTDGFKNIAIRYSENEPIEMALKYKKKADWLWIDIPTKLPLSPKIVKQMKGYKTCLVCPERWGRPQEISKYIKKIKSLKFKLDAVMTSLKYADAWETLNKK
ncbi:MAG TPA: hypothetical protein PLF31_01250 [Candidatus Paceibacterota bacterium]|nr:hypothetical protein [Candidatus Paceibacterota bacterium]